jgi:hypothetical protein
MSDKNIQGQPNSDEPKLIIDEDWKSQVQREKEQFKQKPQETAAEEDSSAVEAGRQSSEAYKEAPPQSESPPPASFEFLVSGIATQAVAAMGQLPDEEGKPLPVNLEYARHFIDLLGVIESKTQGNLSEHEQRFLQDSLHQLRMLFVAVKNA